jgi:ProP effector
MTTTETTPNPFQSARILLKELQEKFSVFGEFLPLAIGIDKQLIAQSPEVSRKALRTALGIHTNSLRYLKGMEKATVRFNLDGSQADEVTDVHRTHATHHAERTPQEKRRSAQGTASGGRNPAQRNPPKNMRKKQIACAPTN